MPDLTVIYYTANRLPPLFMRSVQANILNSLGDAPLISVSCEPLAFGQNVCVGPHVPTTWWIYWQILTGVMLAQTPYVAMAEDDCLYTPEHFSLRPSREDVILYNVNRWQVQEDCYFYRRRASMLACIAPRDYLASALCARFAKYPHPLTPPADTGWGEPGRKDDQIGLPKPNKEEVETRDPILTFNHRDGLGRRHISHADRVVGTLAPWGPASALWTRIHGSV